MWPPTDFSYRKLSRKVKESGYRGAAVQAAELIARKTAVSSAVNALCDRNVFKTVSRERLLEVAERVISVTDNEGSASTITSPFIAEIKPGYVLRDTGLIATPDGVIINESLHPSDRGRRFVVAKLIWQFFFGSPDVATALARGDLDRNDEEHSIEVGVPLIPRYTDNYYHWLIETVPTIRYVREYEQQTGTDVALLIPADPPPWCGETLDLLGIPEDKVKYLNQNIQRVEKLIAPSFPTQTREDYEWIVRTVLANLPSRVRDKAGGNVYISRSSAIERRVVNENEVMAALSPYDFDRHRLENNTVTENVVLFNEADIIVGAHGAGLSDLIYSTNGTVIELFGSKVKDPYEELARTMDVPYHSLRCEPEATDLVVDTQSLVDRVEMVLENSE